MECTETALLPQSESNCNPASYDEGQELKDRKESLVFQQDSVFRCFTCKRIAHYHHLTTPSWLEEDADQFDIAAEYQSNWLCKDCISFTWDVERILAWRPYPESASEVLVQGGSVPNYKNPLPREYLVKWKDRSYRRTAWVPHMWLLHTHQGLLRNFIQYGSKIELVKSSESTIAADDNSETMTLASRAVQQAGTPFAVPDAEDRIPRQWQTIDRVLDARVWRTKALAISSKSRKKKPRQVESDAEDSGLPDENTMKSIFEKGEAPDDKDLQTIEEWEDTKGEDFTIDHVQLIVWAFIKWDDLGYEQCRCSLRKILIL
jgi:chromodomain-helicase-DNA-binding protein 4